jgi:hypothetical protein
MKIELILTDSINEKTTGMSCFDAMFEHQKKAISNCRRIQGICIINDETYKFSFSPYFMDGDVFTTSSSIENKKYYSMVKTIVVEFVYVNRNDLAKPQGKINELKALQSKEPENFDFYQSIIVEEEELLRLEKEKERDC